jgi:hypothetical protein
LVDAAEESVEQLSAVGVVVVGGVVALALQGGPELDAGLEEGAGFADGFEGAVQFGESDAVAVAEQAVVLAAQPGHPRPDRVGRQRIALSLKGFNLSVTAKYSTATVRVGDGIEPVTSSV